MVRTMGHPYDFKAKPWETIFSRVTDLSREHPDFTYLVDVVKSVLESGVSNQIAGALWMMDLAVAQAPVGTKPIDVIIVKGPASLNPPPTGLVRIEHVTVSGRNDVIDRPYAESVPLFWRFIREKYGVVAGRPERS